MSRKNATIEIKQYCASHKNQGKTLRQIKKLARMKGYNVSETTISNWIKEVNTSEKPSSECARYDNAMSITDKREHMYSQIREGDMVMVNTSEGKRKCKVLAKNEHFLVCEINSYRECISKLDVISVS